MGRTMAALVSLIRLSLPTVFLKQRGIPSYSALSEIAIYATDIAELLGVAIAINLLIPAIPLPVAVVLTLTDVFISALLYVRT